MNRPLPDSAVITCTAYPFQVQGSLPDGRRFYFRARWGTAGLGVGTTDDEAIGNYGEQPEPWSFWAEGALDVPAEDCEETRQVFFDLYARAAAGRAA